MTENENLAWAAGFFEGEGCATSSKHKKKLKDGSTKTYYYPKLQVTQRNLEPLEKFQEIVDRGEIYPRNNRKIADWSVFGPEAYDVICLLFEFLSIKRQQECLSCLEDWEMTDLRYS